MDRNVAEKLQITTAGAGFFIDNPDPWRTVFLEQVALSILP